MQVASVVKPQVSANNRSFSDNCGGPRLPVRRRFIAEQNASWVTDQLRAGTFTFTNGVGIEPQVRTGTASMSTCNRASATTLSLTPRHDNDPRSSPWWSPPLEAIFLFYIHIVLFSLHQLYHKSLDDIFTRRGLLSTDSASSWRRSISAVRLSIKVCAPAAVFEILLVF